ncbi:molybdopterin-guanine dinucleotide biosynthesis protein B [Paenibacillus mucilaginosus 3016]|uniref:Molybdopterin-guanine dinucleotide biosynthesis protein B n=1 Tax=Paenibacillus mucilaginosus 3016 TaxID=1116391 RepID=H6NJ77_9BACL|nr:molybdopterin-guanine dinucleotide biosynthesis protein B [Paenibacillus mucilaginosus]AFC28839.1 molybdopterin-guanine dinucleotide biosynthesis protein B [Paenibacillus mucilaginosus 3016]WFA17600.1 molybdopterin-guanine dinucleotide biosynthesis protein B [Paenibacillus mucilaginosus]
MSMTVIGLAGWSDSGKTTLLVKLAGVLEGQGVRVAVIKHDAHGHYKEAEGADSTRFAQAGASAVVVVSPEAVRTYERRRSGLGEALDALRAGGRYELVLVEGFKEEHHDKIAVFRTAEQARILSVLSRPPIAWVTPDEGTAGNRPEGLPVFHPDEVSGIADWIRSRMGNRE